MAEGYKTDEEQVEDLKKWWRENGTSTLVSIAVACAAVFGWQGWQGQQAAKIDAASSVYQNLLTASTGNNEMTDEQRASASFLAETLKKDYPSSTYADFAALYKARFAVESNDLAAAEAELRWILDGGATEEILIQARVRLARVLTAQEKYQEALSILQGGDPAGYKAVYEEARGDIYHAQGELDKALATYQSAKAMNDESEDPVRNPVLDLKLQELTSKLAVKGDA